MRARGGVPATGRIWTADDHLAERVRRGAGPQRLCTGAFSWLPAPAAGPGRDPIMPNLSGFRAAAGIASAATAEAVTEAGENRPAGRPLVRHARCPLHDRSSHTIHCNRLNQRMSRRARSLPAGLLCRCWRSAGKPNRAIPHRDRLTTSANRFPLRVDKAILPVTAACSASAPTGSRNRTRADHLHHGAQDAQRRGARGDLSGAAY